MVETVGSLTGPEYTDRHARGLAALYRISQILADGQQQREVLSDVLAVLNDELGMVRGTITLLSPDGQELITEVGHNLAEEQRRAVIYQLGEGIIGRSVQSGKPAIIPRVSKEPLFLDRLYRRREHLTEEISFICVPILAGNQVVGALSADRPYQEGWLLEKDLQILTIAAGMLAHDVMVRRQMAADRQLLEDENNRLRSELENRYRPENIIGNSRTMREVYQAIGHVASSDTSVLIRGESGTGKELVANAIHFGSKRAAHPFIRVNCAALSEGVFESELFGHEKGAFTGAYEARRGRIEEAEGGTLFLDEIGEFSQSIQIKLLRVLQEREYQRVGSSKTSKANIRIVCATNRDLESAVKAGTFRQDLYYRINVFPIFLPPLRDRRDDILLLADFFVEKYAKRMDKDVRRITTPAINMMFAYHWPGNVRELENCIERAVVLSTDGVIHGHHLPPTLQTSDASDTVGTGSLEQRVDLFERDMIVDALKRCKGRIAAAARELATTERILRYRIKKLRLDIQQIVGQ